MFRIFGLPLTINQMPLDRIQKLSVHFPPLGTACSPGHLAVRLTPLIIVVSGSKQINCLGCPSGSDGSQMVATVYLGPNTMSLPSCRPIRSKSGKCAPGVNISFQVREAVDEALPFERQRIRYIERPHFASRNVLAVGDHMRPCRDVRRPFIAWDVRNSRKRVESENQGHALRA